MAQNLNRIKVDGFTNLIGGVDTWRTPNLLTPNQLAYGINITLRGGYAENRPGFKKQSIEFDDLEIQTWVENHNIQGVEFYQPFKNTPQYVFSSGGRIFTLDIENRYFVREITPTRNILTTATFHTPAIGSSITVAVDSIDFIYEDYPVFIGTGRFTVTQVQPFLLTVRNETTTPGVEVVTGTNVVALDPNPSNLPKAWMVQAGKWMIIQNGRNLPIFYDGTCARRSKRDPMELPTGRMMEFSQGRVWIAINDREFVAGDIDNGPNGVLGFTENTLLNGGGSFTVPENSGKITAMRVMNNLDTSLGQGPLQVFTEQSIFSVNASPFRETWQTTTNPIQTVSMISHGAKSQESTIAINGDLFFRSLDGVRSFIMARRDFTGWGNRPISTEMDRILREDAQGLLESGSAVLFDNRMLMTNRPIPDYAKSATYHCGMISMNFDTISGIGLKSAPIWEGLWTGFNPYILFKGIHDGTERCFAFGRNSTDGLTELWEITRDAKFDNIDDKITSAIETASFMFRNPLEKSRLCQAELWIDRLIGDTTFNLKYRPDQYPCWFEWPSDITAENKYRDCEDGGMNCLLSRNFQPGYRTRLRWGRPPEADEEFDCKPTYDFYETQARLEWTGHARIKALLLKANEIEEEIHAGDLD